MFLTLEDPRARVQGSRDPLGIQPIWVRFGREVVTNLTTVSRVVRGFTVTLLGRYYCERLIEDGRAGEEDAIPIFLRVEQACAYARAARKSDDDPDTILGITRVKRFLAEHDREVPIRNDASGFILSDQKTYGLWGLYSVASRVSGLLEEGPVGLTPVAREFVEQEYIRKLRSVDTKLTDLFLRNKTLDARKGRQPFDKLSKVLSSDLTDAERDFFSATLRDAIYVERPNAPQRQRALAALLMRHSANDTAVDRETIAAISRQADRDGDSSLVDKLGRILRVEATLAPVEALFDLVLTRNGQTVASLSRHLRNQWGTAVPNLEDPLEPLMSEVRSVTGEEQSAELQRCDHALANGDYGEVIVALLDWNRVVMESRGTAPWVKLNGDELDVRYRGGESALPNGDKLASLWRNDYFIGALEDVTFQLENN